eukprot:SAG11_NODE_1573_length_4664_cov_3.235487_3_plen_395_part_00
MHARTRAAAAVVLVAADAAAAAAQFSPASCTSAAAGCSLNGDCVRGHCVCDAAWAGAADCSVLSFEAVAKTSGEAPGYYNKTEASWGGNIIKGDDGQYNLIHAQFKNHCGIYSTPGGWTNNSFVARSVSTSGKPEGPYQFVEEILPPFAHNPEVHRDVSDGSFVVFYIGGWQTTVAICNLTAHERTAAAAAAALQARQGRHPPRAPNCTAPNWGKSCGPKMAGPTADLCGPCRQGLNCGCGLAVATASSLSGPWTSRALPIVDQWRSDEVFCTHTNPTVHVMPNGTWVMAFNAGMCLGRESIGTAVSHGGWRGPWRLLSRNAVLRNTDGAPHTCEDPFIWHSRRGWHLLAHSYGGAHISAYGYSVDGLEWTLSNSTPYNYTVHYTCAPRQPPNL